MPISTVFMNSALPTRLRSPWLWLAIGLAAVYIRGLFLDVMDVDASQYASISMEMLQGGNLEAWLQVQHRGTDYLDKPPLLFWLSTSSFWLFGMSNWAYKLPSFLAALAGIWAVYRFTRLYYGAQSGLHAAFILASCMGLMVICNDVRTDTVLLGFSACAVWQLAEYLEFKHWRNLLAGFSFIGLAMLAKGPIGLVMPAFAVGSHLLLRRDWKGIFKWQWLPGLVVVALLLAPMCWGLWQQFDLHPEKLVNGRYGVSGLRFFFWEQSFGRVTGENVWKNDASGFYFMHVYLWAFLPWCLLLPLAIWQRAKDLARPSKHPSVPEFFALGGFLITFVALSQSQYKLPHYIFITLPWAAVLVASRPASRLSWVALYVAGWLALAIAFFVLYFVFPTSNWLIWGITLVSSVMLIRRVIQNPFPADPSILVQRGTWVALIFGFVLNFHFYPKLLPYQSMPQAARFARSVGIPPEKMYFFNSSSHAMDFYNGDIMTLLETPESLAETSREVGEIWVYTTESGKTQLEEAGIGFEETERFVHFQVTLLNFQFLNPSTREEALGRYFLLKIPVSGG